MAGVLDGQVVVDDGGGWLRACRPAGVRQLLAEFAIRQLPLKVGEAGPGSSCHAGEGDYGSGEIGRQRLAEATAQQSGQGDAAHPKERVSAANQQQLLEVAETDEVGIYLRHPKAEGVEVVEIARAKHDQKEHRDGHHHGEHQGLAAEQSDEQAGETDGEDQCRQRREQGEQHVGLPGKDGVGCEEAVNDGHGDEHDHVQSAEHGGNAEHLAHQVVDVGE